MTSLGTLELQLTANQAALYQQLNQTRAYATQVARDIERQINQAFSLTGLNQSTAQAASAGQSAGGSFTDRFKMAVEPIKGILNSIFTGFFVGAGIGAFNSITGVVGSALGAVQQFAGEIFNVTKDFQGFEASLKTFLKGNQKEVDNFVSGLEKFAATTPFELRDLQQAAIQNLATGAKPDQIIKDLKTIGDVATGANANLKELMEVYAKSRTEGRLKNKDIDQFTGRGVQLRGGLAEMLGANELEIRQLATDGKLEFRHLEEALRRMSAEGGAYFGAMENKAKTLEGRLSNVQDTFYQFQKSIGQAFEPIMNFAVQTFGEIVSGLTSSNGIMQDVRKEAEKLVASLKANPELVQSINKAIQELVAGGFKLLLDGITNFTKYLETNPNIIKDMSIAFNDFWGVVKDVSGYLKIIFDWIKSIINVTQAISPVLGKILDIVFFLGKRLVDNILWGWNEIAKTVDRLIKLIQFLFDGIVKLTTNGIDLFNKGLENAVSITKAIGANIGNWASNIGGATEAAFQFAQKGIAGIGGAIEAVSGGIGGVFEGAKKQVKGFWDWATGQGQQATATPQSQATGKTQTQGQPGGGNGVNNIDGTETLIKPTPAPASKRGFGVHKHPIYGDMRMHYGQDFPDAEGTPIKAPLSGKIITAKEDRYSKKGAGTTIELETITAEGQKIVNRFFHLSDLLKQVGDVVKQGEIIGKVGNTGGSTGPHTHWEILLNGKRIDPMSQLGKSFNLGKNPVVASNAQQTSTPTQQSLQGNAVLWGQAANYSPSDLSKLSERGKKAMEALQNPNVRAFLDAVAIAEVGAKGASQGGYGYLIGDDVKGRESFDPNSLESHPRRKIKYGPGKNQISSATGRYQVLDIVWDEEAGRLGLKDFKPQSQEILAVSRLMYREILDEIMAGDFKSVIKRSGNMDASSEWASLAGNPYGQGSPTGKLGVFLSNIDKSLQSQKTQSQSAPQQSSAQTPATGGNDGDQRNLVAARRKLAETKYKEIKEEIEAADKQADAAKKQQRQLDTQRRDALDQLIRADFAAREALAPNDEAKKIVQNRAKQYDIDNRYQEKLIKYSEEREDLLDARETKLKILATAKERGEDVMPDDAGMDYSKAINQLDEVIEIQKQLRDLELETNNLNQFNAEKEIEKNKDREREIEKLSRTHEAYINQLRLEQSLADDARKQSIQSKIDKAQIEHQTKIALMPLRNQLDDLQDAKVYLLGKGGLKADSDQVKRLQKDIDELIAKIHAIADKGGVDLKIFENQLKQVEEQTRRLKESDFINNKTEILSGQARLIRGRGGDEYQASALEAEAARIQEQVRYKQELLRIEQEIGAAKGTSNEYTEEEIATIQANAEAINRINLEGISQQVRTLGKDLLDIGKNAFGSFFGDIISGSKSAGDAFKDLIGNIAQQLTQLAVKMLTSDLFGGGGSGGGGLFGGLFGGLLGGGGGLFGGGGFGYDDFLGGEGGTIGVLGLYQGGIVPNYARGGSVGAVANALHRERSMSGKNPVLAALTPGEIVLTTEQAKRFQELRLDKVLNFANGGVVDGGQNLSSEIGAKNMTINIPVTVQGTSESSIDVLQLQNSVRSVVLAEIQKQQRPGGALNK